MRYTDLVGKEIIDIGEGNRLGVVSNSDLYIDVETGRIAAIIIPQRSGWFSHREMVIPWHGVRKIGADFIVVDTCYSSEQGYLQAVPEEEAVEPTTLPSTPQVPTRRVSGMPLTRKKFSLTTSGYLRHNKE
jgi:YlmC/YmxH family sporulation protein